jgi:hypothetical protein
MSDNRESTNATPASVRRQSGVPRSRGILGDVEQLYVDMKAAVQSPRKKRNLGNVWRALEHPAEMKSTDFSIASVARAIQALSLSEPKEQSIRNTEGKDFRDLIRAYGNEHGVPAKGASESSEEERIVGSIVDLRTASMVRELLNENRSKDRRINMLKNLIGKSPPFGIASELSPNPSAPKAEAISSRMNWNSIETAAVVSFLRNIRDSGEDFNLRFEPASGALLWKDGVVEVARLGSLGVLIKIAGEEK